MTNQKIERKTHVFDAGSDSLGRLASKVAVILRGKHKPTYCPHKDEGDIVIVENISNMKLTGKKLEQKVYYRYTGYRLKEKKMKEIFSENPSRILQDAVYNMLPNNKLRDVVIKRLQIRE